MPGSPAVSVRPPWPDEGPRLHAFLPALVQKNKAQKAHLFVLQASAPERLVGAAALVTGTSALDNGGASLARGRLFLNVRPRFVENGSAKRLFADVLAQADDLGLTKIFAEVSAGDVATAKALADAGFAHRRTEELWRMELPHLLRRTERVAQVLHLPESWNVRVPTEADLPFLGKMAEHYRFRQTREIQLDHPRDRPGTYYSAELSTVVEAEGKILAALLVKASAGLNCHTDLRMTDPEVRAMSARLNLALLYHSSRAVTAAGYATTTLTVNTARDRETRRLAERSGGRLITSKELWVCDL